MVSHSELGLDSPIGSDRKSGCASLPLYMFWELFGCVLELGWLIVILN